MSVIYILSDSSNPNDQYKVGIHSNSFEELLSRYITEVPQVKIYYFIYVDKAKEIEDIFKFKFYNQRIQNINGNISEWFNMPLIDIVVELLKIIREHKKFDFYTLPFKNSCIMIPIHCSAILDYWNNKINSSTRDIQKIAISDEYRLNELKIKRVRYRASRGECMTQEEVERYQLNERIKKRKSRAKQKQLLSTQTPLTQDQYVPIQSGLTFGNISSNNDIMIDMSKLNINSIENSQVVSSPPKSLSRIDISMGEKSVTIYI